MGCGGSREKESGIHAPLDHWMEPIEIDEVDKIFGDASETIKSAEHIRQFVVDQKDHLIKESGACSHKEPTIKECFFGICWKLSADNKGKFLDAGFKPSNDMKGLVLDGQNNSAEVKKAYQTFNDYVKGLIEMNDKVEELKTKSEQLSKVLKENTEELPKKVADKFKDDMFSQKNKILAENMIKVKNAVAIIPQICEEYAKNVAFMKEIANILNQNEEIGKIDNIGKKAFDSKHVKAYEICFHHIDATLRHGKKPEDGLNFWSSRIQGKTARLAEKKK